MSRRTVAASTSACASSRVGLRRRGEPVLREGERCRRRAARLERPRRDPRVERRLELVAEARAVEGLQLGLVLGVGVDPLDEGGDVDLRQGIRTVRGPGLPRSGSCSRGSTSSPARRSSAWPGSCSTLSRPRRTRAGSPPRPRPSSACPRCSRGLSSFVARRIRCPIDSGERLVERAQHALHRHGLNAADAVLERTVEELDQEQHRGERRRDAIP